MFKNIKKDLMKGMKVRIYLCTVAIMTVFFLAYSSTNYIDASSEPVFYDSENGSIKIDQGQYLKPKYVHEPVQLHISGKISDYQRAEATQLTITPPSGDVVENIIRPTREGEFDFIAQITSNHSTGEYEIRIIHKEAIIGPATFRITSEKENEASIQEVPEWVKNNAGWWADGLIGNNDFVEAIQYLINQGVIKIPPATVGTETGANEIPEWVKNNAGWWADGLIGTGDFVKGIQFLVEQGIIKIV